MTCSPEAKRKPNKGMELTASSVRSCLAPASGSSSCLAVRAGDSVTDANSSLRTMRYDLLQSGTN